MTWIIDILMSVLLFFGWVSEPAQSVVATSTPHTTVVMSTPIICEPEKTQSVLQAVVSLSAIELTPEQKESSYIDTATTTFAWSDTDILIATCTHVYELITTTSDPVSPLPTGNVKSVLQQIGWQRDSVVRIDGLPSLQLAHAGGPFTNTEIFVRGSSTADALQFLQLTERSELDRFVDHEPVCPCVHTMQLKLSPWVMFEAASTTNER